MEIDVPEYNVNTGLRLCWCDGYSVKISTNDNEVREFGIRYSL